MNETGGQFYRADGTAVPLDVDGVRLLWEADRLPGGLWAETRYDPWGQVIE